MVRRGAGGYTARMDRNEAERQAALRARAEEAIEAALAAANARAPIPSLIVDSAMSAVRLVCWDGSLDARSRLVLIDDALRLLAALKGLAHSPEPARPALIVELLRGTNALLRRYAAFVGAEPKVP